MQPYSTPESEVAGEITWLSIVETIIAMAIYYVIWRSTGSLHLAIMAVIAPMMLLRTEVSTKLALKWQAAIDAPPLKMPDGPYRLEFVCAIALWNGICWIPYRFMATFVTFLCHPITSLRAIPTNWMRIVLCLDVFRPPESLPGYESAGGDFTFSNVVRYVRNDLRLCLSNGVGPVGIFVEFFFAITYLTLGFLPSLLFRWSIKGTSWIYLPVLFIVPIYFPSGDYSLTERITQFKSWTPLSILIRIYSLCMLLLFAGTILLHVYWCSLQTWWNSYPLLQPFTPYFEPTEIPMWQAATGINALITIALFFFAYEAIPPLNNGKWTEVTVERMLYCVQSARWLLTVYAIYCLIIITWKEAHLLEYWNRIDWGPWFP